MTEPHRERSLEDIVEVSLLARGWRQGSPSDYDRARALRPNDYLDFLRVAAPEAEKEAVKRLGDGRAPIILEALTRSLRQRGTIDVLRHGFKANGVKLPAAVFPPAHGLNPDLEKRYRENRLVVTRQVRFTPDADNSVDLTFTLNGIAVATVELKTQLTGQDVRDAIKQYKRRDPRVPLFAYKSGALVHFAVDADEAWMTTRLGGDTTRFLPFNRGRDGGAGNPPHPSGHRTAYLWEDVWSFDSFMDILARFVHVLNPGKDDEQLVFPRYHQLDGVRRLVAAAREEGVGHSYLVQHSAGSGKTNSIAWLAHRLSNLHDERDEKVFHSVIVVTDRILLDRQLQDAVYQFEHAQGVVEKIEKDSQQLGQALRNNVPIIVTTLWKFPHVADTTKDLPERRYAIIVDEAHSSQTGEAARELKEVLGAGSLEEAARQEAQSGPDDEDRIAEVMASRGRQPNLSFFAFTATPKDKTLQLFGRRNADGRPVAFHIYSMRQAIEEKFILDVLANYTTYSRWYKLAKAIEEDPELPKRKAQAALARFMSLHPHDLSQKAEVIIEHFRRTVRHKLDGRAKAMVVTSSRLHAVRYVKAFRAYLEDRGYADMGVLVAFSGGVIDEAGTDPVRETELNTATALARGMSAFRSEAELAKRFKDEDWQVLIVAEKYQTGFDEPLLAAMYVDKRLDGVRAVQTLSRLNRMYPGKESVFVLDFVNDAEAIREAFQPYYEVTALDQPAEPQHLYKLQSELDATQVYLASEVSAFAKVFYLPRERQRPSDQARYEAHLAPAVDRFRALGHDEQEAFRGKLGAYVKLYSFLSQVAGFVDPDLERLYSFGKLLWKKLPRIDVGGALQLDDDVELKYYRLQKASEGAITLMSGETGFLTGPTEVGTAQVGEERDRLSRIIDRLNERFGLGLTARDELFLQQTEEDAKADEEVAERAQANARDNFVMYLSARLMDTMVDQMAKNEELVTTLLNRPDVREAALKEMSGRIYDALRKTAS